MEGALAGDIAIITDQNGIERSRVGFDSTGSKIRYATIKKYKKWLRDSKVLYLRSTESYKKTKRRIDGRHKG